MKVKINDSEKVNAQQSGVWANFGDSSFKIAHMANMKFQRMLNRLQAPHRKEIAKGSLDPVISKQIMCESMAKGLVLDWKGVEDATGEMPFSTDLCQKMLTNNDDVREFVQDFANDMSNYKSEVTAEEGKS